MTVHWQEGKKPDSIPCKHAHWPSVVCVKQKTNKQASCCRPPSIFTLCRLQTIPNGDIVGFPNKTWNTKALHFNQFMPLVCDYVFN